MSAASGRSATGRRRSRRTPTAVCAPRRRGTSGRGPRRAQVPGWRAPGRTTCYAPPPPPSPGLSGRRTAARGGGGARTKDDRPSGASARRWGKEAEAGAGRPKRWASASTAERTEPKASYTGPPDHPPRRAAPRTRKARQKGLNFARPRSALHADLSKATPRRGWVPVLTSPVKGSGRASPRAPPVRPQRHFALNKRFEPARNLQLTDGVFQRSKRPDKSTEKNQSYSRRFYYLGDLERLHF